jgi:outer membrane protein OmpA-like peptidoglycan-associated protein
MHHLGRRNVRILGVAALAALSVAGSNLGGCAAKGEHSQLVRAPERCADQTVQVYFDPWSAELTREGRAVIDAAAAGARACRVASVEVLGLADAIGAPEPNLELSQKRAEAVSQALARAGLPAAEFRVAAAGQEGAVTPAGAAAPLRRRVDVTLHVAAP